MELATLEWVADVLQDEQLRLMPNPKPLDGYVEVLARVSSTALVHLQRNRYSVPTEHAHEVVSLRLYPERIDVVADNTRIASHARSFERSLTFYDWRHYVSLIERKPGALRNGAPFATLPEPLKKLQAIITALRALKLHGMAANHPEVAAKARHTEFSPEAFLGQLLRAEQAERTARSMAHQMGAARFPAHRDLAGF